MTSPNPNSTPVCVVYLSDYNYKLCVHKCICPVLVYNSQCASQFTKLSIHNNNASKQYNMDHPVIL